MCPWQVCSFYGGVYVCASCFKFTQMVSCQTSYFIYFPFYLKLDLLGLTHVVLQMGYLLGTTHIPTPHSEGCPSLPQFAATASSASRSLGHAPCRPGWCSKVHTKGWDCWVTGTCCRNCFRSWQIASGRAGPCKLLLAVSGKSCWENKLRELWEFFDKADIILAKWTAPLNDVWAYK